MTMPFMQMSTRTQQNVFVHITAKLQFAINEVIKYIIPEKTSLFTDDQYKDSITNSDCVLLRIDLKDICKCSQYRTYKRAFSEISNTPIQIPLNNSFEYVQNSKSIKFPSLFKAILSPKYKTEISILIDKRVAKLWIDVHNDLVRQIFVAFSS
ncbi:hypothetical protein [Bacteroides sp.]|uniref:hypothetical protein n=1 Tax=Bacteroides sp. TaxID=29523 RepID=UPI0026073387|nr:hypothetical protein [Bacteroides sp.]MDD3039802.1 hypothetical protein [Bacteroides sp.]